MIRTESRPSPLPRVLVLAIAAGLLGGCSTLGLGGSDEPRAPTTSASSGSSFSEFFRNGGSTVPPPPAPVDDDIDCPAVEILDGGAAMRQVAGSDVRNQISLGQVARECRAAGPGQIAIKVGVEGRVLLGPAGSPGSYGATLTTTVTRGTSVLGKRSARVGGTIPSGQSGIDFTHVEDGIMVPAGKGDVEIFVGLGGGGPAAPARKRRR